MYRHIMTLPPLFMETLRRRCWCGMGVIRQEHFHSSAGGAPTFIKLLHRFPHFKRTYVWIAFPLGFLPCSSRASTNKQ